MSFHGTLDLLDLWIIILAATLIISLLGFRIAWRTGNGIADRLYGEREP